MFHIVTRCGHMRMVYYPYVYRYQTVICNGRRFFLLALSEFDQDYHASLNFDGYFQAICSLIHYADKNSQGADIAMPVIGGGLSRLHSDIGDLLNLQVRIIKAMGGLDNGGDVKIIVHQNNKRIVCLPHVGR